MNPHKHLSFPGLSTAMNIKAMTRSLLDVFSRDAPNLDIIDGRIGDVRYDANRQHYIILYHLNVKNRSTNRRRKHLLTGTVLTEEAFAQQDLSSAKESSDTFRQQWIHKSCFVLPDKKVVLYAFPNDTVLTWLPDAVDPGVMKELLNRIWARHSLKVRKVKLEVLGYTPQMRASFLYDILFEDRRTKANQRKQLIGKTNAFKKPDHLFAAAWALWQASGGDIGFATPVAFLTEPRLTLQERVPGKRLGSLVDSPMLTSILTATAEAIARFHSLSIPIKNRRKLKDEVRSIDRWSNVITQIRPDLKRRVESFRKNLIEDITRRMCIRAPVHADFHHTNVLVHGTQVRLIDLDEVALGDPCVDIGRFMASLRIPSLRAFGSIDKLNDARERFLAAYLRVRNEDVRNIHLFESAGLLVSAASAFRIQRPNCLEEAGLLLEEAERVFDLSRTGAIYAGLSDYKRPPLSPAERFRWAADQTFMHALLAPVVHERWSADPVDCQLIRKKRFSRGQWVEYELRGWMGNERWKSRVFGLLPDKPEGSAVFSRLVRLKQALKGTDGEHLLPRPLGYLSQIGMLVFESVSGRPLTAFIGTEQNGQSLEAAGHLAKALSALHNAGIEFSKTYSLDRELTKTRKRLERLRNDHPTFFGRADRLYSEIETRIKSAPHKTGPILCRIGLHGIRCSNDHITVTDILDVRFSHPYLDVGHLLSQLVVLGMRQGKLKDAMDFSRQFRGVYKASSEAGENCLSAFEAAALIRLACNHLQSNQHDGLPFTLLAYAEERISHES